MKVTKYVKDWFERGDDDISNAVCFHGQQAAEKYLKGFLAYHEKHVRKIHDLGVLLDECRKLDHSFESLKEEAGFLAQFYTESRYPDDYVEFSQTEAQKALEAAHRFKKFILDKIPSGE